MFPLGFEMKNGKMFHQTKKNKRRKNENKKTCKRG